MRVDFVNLVEYDIHSAAYSIIINEQLHLQFSGINLNTLVALKNDKKRRNILIGRYQRDCKGLSEILTTKYKEILAEFQSVNAIPDDKVYYRTRDSLIFNTGNHHKSIEGNIGRYVLSSGDKYYLYVSYKRGRLSRHVFLGEDDFSVKGISKLVNRNFELFRMFFTMVINSYRTNGASLLFYQSCSKALEVCRTQLQHCGKGFELEYEGLIIDAQYAPQKALDEKVVFTQEAFDELNALVTSFK